MTHIDRRPPNLVPNFRSSGAGTNGTATLRLVEDESKAELDGVIVNLKVAHP